VRGTGFIGKHSLTQQQTTSSPPASNSIPISLNAIKMHCSLLAPLLIAPVAAYTCDGDTFNNFCCVNGHFSGPVVSSLSSSLSTAEASRGASQSAFQSSLSSSLSAAAASRSREQVSEQASRSSQLATIGVRTATEFDAPAVTARAILKRTITTEVSPGLTCIGDSVIAESGADISFVESSTTFIGVKWKLY
jgi:hypothetical protein